MQFKVITKSLHYPNPNTYDATSLYSYTIELKEIIDLLGYLLSYVDFSN